VQTQLQLVPAAPSSLTDYHLLLGEISYLLLQDVDPHTLAEIVYSRLCEDLALEAYVHYLVAPDGSHLQLASAGGSANIRPHLGPTLALGQAVCGTVAQTCEWMHITGVQQRTDQMTGLIRSLGLRAYTCQPLFARGKLVGTFSFGSTSRDGFLKEELDLFQLVAEQIALAAAPIVAVLLGWWMAGERITLNFGFAAAMIIGAVVLVDRGTSQIERVENPS